MRRISLSVNGRILHVYIDGDEVELGQQGQPISRRDRSVTIAGDVQPVRRTESMAYTHTLVDYDVHVVEVENL